jgi:hypothetical protein
MQRNEGIRAAAMRDEESRSKKPELRRKTNLLKWLPPYHSGF